MSDEAIPFVQSGQIRLLGIMAEKRHEQLPEVPTFKEQGYGVISSSRKSPPPRD
ncbi:tripartite tricarboxylate transporter substrate-binding protein [Acetomicrobium sp.]|uniref:tripartite tricarboxylate transporter substrate-binding protein n=1 Tax=Acetomicrobium sp. TaxID=1872099 RepID=UPI002FC99007